MFKSEILIYLCCLFHSILFYSLNFFYLFTFNYSQANGSRKICIFRLGPSVDIISWRSESAALVAMVWEAFTSNLLVEEFSHSSSKNPKHLWDLTSRPCLCSDGATKTVIIERGDSWQIEAVLLAMAQKLRLEESLFENISILMFIIFKSFVFWHTEQNKESWITNSRSLSTV